MKIIFIVDRFPVISESFIVQQIAGILQRGHEVTVFASRSNNTKFIHPLIHKYSILDKTIIVPLPKNPYMRKIKALILLISLILKRPHLIKALNFKRYGKNVLSFKRLYILKYTLDQKIDVIHCHFGPNGIIGSFLKDMGIQGKLYTTFHGYDINKFVSLKGKDVYKNLFFNADLIFPVSEYFKKQLADLGCPNHKLKIHHCGIDLDVYHPAKKTQSDKFTILTLARLSEKKGHIYAIRAFAEVVKTQQNLKYIIAGGGPLMAQLKKLVSELKLEKYVHFTDTLSQDEAMECMLKSDLFLLPSVSASDGDIEGIPVSINEAQSLEIPVISSFHAGIPEGVIHEKTGFLAPERDVNTLVKHLNMLIENIELRNKLGKNARQHVNKEFNIKTLNDQLIDIYQS